MKEIIQLENGRIRVRTVNSKPSKTDQQWKDDCDTNTIIQRFKTTGQITHLSKTQGSFADVSDIPDLLPNLLLLKSAQEQFHNLPSNLRRKFNNSYQELIGFLQDPNNKEEAIELGLLPGPKPDGMIDKSSVNKRKRVSKSEPEPGKATGLEEEEKKKD